MTNFHKAVLTLAVLLACGSLALGQGTYTQIDYPGALATFAVGIDQAGDITGGYEDSNQVNHGFLLSGGVYTTIDYPGGSGTSLGGINDLGQMVGQSTVGGVPIGFMYDLQTQTFTTLGCPGDNCVGNFPTAINNAGTITGFLELQGENGSSPVGFELIGSKYREVLPSGYSTSSLTGVNNSGIALGSANTSSNQVINFLFTGGKLTKLELPGMPPVTMGINDKNAIVGANYLANGVVKGFVYQRGTFQRLVFAGSNWTAANGINNAGEVVGSFVESSGGEHGFSWVPDEAGKR